MQLLLAILMLVSPFGRPNKLASFTRPRAAVETCTGEVKEDITTGGANNGAMYVGGDMKALGSFFTASASYTVCSVGAVLYREAASAHNLTASIYTDNSGSPGTLVGTASDPVAISTLGTDVGGTVITFPNMSAGVVSGTNYWVVLTVDTKDWSGYAYQVAKGTTGCTCHKYSGDGTTWNNMFNATGRYKVMR